MVTTFFACSNSSSETSGTYSGPKLDLVWQVDQPIQYKTVMSEISSTEFDNVFEKFLGKKSDDMRGELLENMNKVVKNTDFICTLKASEFFEDVVEIEMNASKKEEEDDSFPFNEMLQGCVLRGSVFTSGAYHSYWVKASQTNLLSMLFELPTEKVGVGDTWSLDNLHLIQNDQNFACENYESTNEVRVESIDQINGHTVVSISYNIYEFAEGDFNNPMGFGSSKKGTKTSIRFDFVGDAEFDVDAGRWLSYNAVLANKITGISEMDSKQRIALIPKK